jgi:hypothetical protein
MRVEQVVMTHHSTTTGFQLPRATGQPARLRNAGTPLNAFWLLGVAAVIDLSISQFDLIFPGSHGGGGAARAVIHGQLLINRTLFQGGRGLLVIRYYTLVCVMVILST